ncbi:type II toxin-antitoxin system VapC family toxin [Castellaniella sp.]|uniref:type II toxin-antitoxin system VapC family toxin n=1 Tax=Castellaniella sp. TaxID=1955812 RepID=UPI002AFFAB5A|nr:type II toxin-antitoxin system VapC family toxin [Castellaniella sp.]
MAAILRREPKAATFVQFIHDAAACHIRVANYVKLSIVVEKQLGPDGMQQDDTFFGRAGIAIEPVTVEQGHLARKAFLDFGKGRRKAGLTMAIASPMRWQNTTASPCCSKVRISAKRTFNGSQWGK